jgi:hypothetical protein
MASMPHLVQMDKKYSKKGLQVIGAHVQAATDDELKGIIKSYKIGFPIATRVNSPVPSNGIPHMVVFGADGKLVFAGHPSNPDAEKAIKAALKKVDAPGGSAEDSGSSLLAPRTETLVELRTWTNAEGKSMKAKLLSVEGSTGKFAFADGRKFDYAIEKLSEEDQKFITDKVTTPADE